jgi:hypothetical protein
VDAAGLLVAAGPGSAASVSISLDANTAGATLACPGGSTQAAVAGNATFAGCSIDRPGSALVIRAEAAGLPPVLSAPFDILDAGAALPLTLAAGPTTITVGADVALTAHFAPAPATADRTLELERSIDGVHWSPTSIGRATDAAGSATLGARPSVTGWYRVRFAGSADLAAATSYPVRVVVRQSIALAASVRPGRTIARGTTVAFTSTVQPAGAASGRPGSSTGASR